MKTTPVSIEDLRGVFPVPPLARRNDARRPIDFEQNDRIVRHIADGGLTRFLYGGNAFLYHVTLAEYESLLDWLSGFADGLWAIPSLGPSYGRAMDQASILRRYKFPCAMALPCGDPRDAKGLETGLREIAETANTPLILYLKDENNFGADKEAGLDVVARLVDEDVCVAIKYAVVWPNPAEDAYLESLLKRVDRARVISGIGERPAVIHMRDWNLPGFTTGSGCVAPRLSRLIFEACVEGDYETAEKLRAEFLPLEDLRDAWSPAKVLHFATQLAGVAETGTVPPFLSSLSEEPLKKLAPVARRLVERNAR
ncbi:MAG TPA: dihydrodipicolinate synthase family protein [Blastocatellia bacterium]|nr:dihydrodipicolinate synthase family protein [Blastocatellia bacterium]